MKNVHLVFIFATLCAGQAFECGIHMSRNEELKTVISKCVTSNKTLEDLWDIAPMSSEDSSADEEPSVDTKMSQNFRTRRSSVKTIDSKLDSDDSDTKQSNKTSGPVTENCIIQCIFENLEMTDNTGYPEHTKVLDGLLKNATNPELRDFFQDTTDECFQEMDKEDTMDPCSFSIKLVTCLAEKGKTNCADWPVGDLPFHQ